MIDTIILTLPRDKFRIADPDKFKPSARYLGKNNNNIKSIQNSTKKELLAGIYKPRLTLQNRINKFGKAELILKIELSLPKLFFGNNFEELKYKDFSKLSLKLVFVLSDMGIILNRRQKIKKIFEKLKIKSDLTFKKIFKPYKILRIFLAKAGVT